MVDVYPARKKEHGRVLLAGTDVTKGAAFPGRDVGTSALTNRHVPVNVSQFPQRIKLVVAKVSVVDSM